MRIKISSIYVLFVILNAINCDHSGNHVIVKRRAQVNVPAPDWWKEWWAKYIRDVTDPTVRPLLVSAAGNSIDYDVQRPEIDEIDIRPLPQRPLRPSQPSRPVPENGRRIPLRVPLPNGLPEGNEIDEPISSKGPDEERPQRPERPTKGSREPLPKPISQPMSSIPAQPVPRPRPVPRPQPVPQPLQPLPRLVPQSEFRPTQRRPERPLEEEEPEEPSPRSVTQKPIPQPPSQRPAKSGVKGYQQPSSKPVPRIVPQRPISTPFPSTRPVPRIPSTVSGVKDRPGFRPRPERPVIDEPKQPLPRPVPVPQPPVPRPVPQRPVQPPSRPVPRPLPQRPLVPGVKGRQPRPVTRPTPQHPMRPEKPTVDRSQKPLPRPMPQIPLRPVPRPMPHIPLRPVPRPIPQIPMRPVPRPTPQQPMRPVSRPTQMRPSQITPRPGLRPMPQITLSPEPQRPFRPGVKSSPKPKSQFPAPHRDGYPAPFTPKVTEDIFPTTRPEIKKPQTHPSTRIPSRNIPIIPTSRPQEVTESPDEEEETERPKTFIHTKTRPRMTISPIGPTFRPRPKATFSPTETDVITEIDYDRETTPLPQKSIPTRARSTFSPIQFPTLRPRPRQPSITPKFIPTKTRPRPETRPEIKVTQRPKLSPATEEPDYEVDTEEPTRPSISFRPASTFRPVFKPIPSLKPIPQQKPSTRHQIDQTEIPTPKPTRPSKTRTTTMQTFVPTLHSFLPKQTTKLAPIPTDYPDYEEETTPKPRPIPTRARPTDFPSPRPKSFITSKPDSQVTGGTVSSLDYIDETLSPVRPTRPSKTRPVTVPSSFVTRPSFRPQTEETDYDEQTTQPPLSYPRPISSSFKPTQTSKTKVTTEETDYEYDNITPHFSSTPPTKTQPSVRPQQPLRPRPPLSIPTFRPVPTITDYDITTKSPLRTQLPARRPLPTSRPAPAPRPQRPSFVEQTKIPILSQTTTPFPFDNEESDYDQPTTKSVIQTPSRVPIISRPLSPTKSPFAPRTSPIGSLTPGKVRPFTTDATIGEDYEDTTTPSLPGIPTESSIVDEEDIESDYDDRTTTAIPQRPPTRSPFRTSPEISTPEFGQRVLRPISPPLSRPSTSPDIYGPGTQIISSTPLPPKQRLVPPKPQHPLSTPASPKPRPTTTTRLPINQQPEIVYSVDSEDDYDGSDGITMPDYQPTRRPSLKETSPSHIPAAPKHPSRPSISPISPRRPGVKIPGVKSPNAVAVYNPPLGPPLSVPRPDRPLADGSMPDCTLLGQNYCIITKDYPMDGIKDVVNKSYNRIKLMYEELQTVGDPDLFKDHVGDSPAASGQFACETESSLTKPGWARDEITKEWMVIVNTDLFPQQVRTESCKKPNEPCSFVSPFYESTCQQRFSLHRLIAVDPHDPGKSPVVALFKFPAGCSCRVHPIKIESK